MKDVAWGIAAISGILLILAGIFHTDWLLLAAGILVLGIGLVATQGEGGGG